MLLAVLYFGLCVANTLAVDACIQLRPCLCGTSGESYMRCFDDESEQYSCESWVNCQTCEDYNEFCVTCPPGRFGKTCENESVPTSEPSCIPPERIKNGFIQNDVPEMQRFPLNSVLNFKCMEGYELVGSPAIQCLRPAEQLGYWSGIPPICRSIAKTTNTANDCNFNAIGSRSFNCTRQANNVVLCDVTCDDNHKERYRCFQGIGWQPTLPTCEASKGSVPGNSQFLNLHSSYVLLPEPKGRPMIEAKVTCRDPGTPPNAGRRGLDGMVIPPKYSFDEGESLIFFCNDRQATLQGSSRLICRKDGRWDGNLPQCVASSKDKEILSCKKPEIVENGIIEDLGSAADQYPPGAELRYRCREGYVREGPEFIQCLPNLSWSEKPAVCKPISTTTVLTTCDHPGEIENGVIQIPLPVMQSFPLKTVLSFNCMERYELVGKPEIECISTTDQLTSWSDPLPECRPITQVSELRPTKGVSCQNPGMVENGMFENHPLETVSFQLGSLLKLKCMEGYEMEGPDFIVCVLPGEWSGSLPVCRIIPSAQEAEVFCRHPGAVPNGTFEGKNQSRFPVGTTLTFRCRSGTRIEGHRNIYCLNTGKWSADAPICMPIRRESHRGSSTSVCRHPGEIPNGMSEPNAMRSETFLAGQQIKFRCSEDYTLEGLDTINCESSGKWSSAPPVCRRSRKTQDCGRARRNAYKTTGQHTRSDWPWTVILSKGNEVDAERVFCGGALLNSRTVLTAAHCITSAQNIKLHFDYHRPRGDQVRNISQIIMHPDYDDETHANDIALLKLQRPVYYDPRTQPICLPQQTINSSWKNLHPGTTTYVTGYRLEFVKNQTSTPAFKVFELPVQSTEACDNVCRDQDLVSCGPSTFCAGYLTDSKECIYGGTPLVVHHKETDRYTLEGLVTRAASASDIWEGRCKRAESYTTFTNVSHFMPFISENLDEMMG